MLSNISYKFSAIADFSSIQYNQDTLLKLLQGFEGENWVPNMMQMPTPNGYVTGGGIQLFSEQNNRNITLMPNRFDVQWSAEQKQGFVIEEQETAFREMPEQMKRLYGILGDGIPEAMRLAWDVVYAYFEIDEETRKQFRSRFLKDTSFYAEHAVDEFAANYVARTEADIAGSKENINVVTNMNRWFPEAGMGFRVDGYRIEFDINTDQWNKKTRFAPEMFGEFVAKAVEIQRLLEKEVLDGCH